MDNDGFSHTTYQQRRVIQSERFPFESIERENEKKARKAFLLKEIQSSMFTKQRHDDPNLSLHTKTPSTRCEE